MTTLDRQPSNLSRIDDEKNPDEVVEHSGRLSQDGPLESKFAHLNRKQALRVYWKSIMWGLAFCAGVLCDGYAIVLPGSIVANPGFVAQFATLTTAQGKPKLDPSIVGAWGGVQSGSQIVMQYLAGHLSDRFGRKAMLYLFIIFLSCAAALEITAQNWQTYMGARIFTGLAVACVQSVSTVYLAEVSVPQIRGFMIACYSVLWNIGGLAASIALKVVVMLPPEKFRHAFYSQFVFMGLLLPIIPFVPESVWYYARRHEHDKAKRSMVRLYGNIKDWDLEHEYEVVRQNVAHTEALRAEQGTAPWTEIFRGSNGRRTFVSFVAAMFGNLVGLSLVFGYTSYFFALAGVKDPFLGSMMIKIILNVFTVASFWTTELIGRRPSLLTGGGVMFVMMMLLGILRSTGNQDQGIVIVTFFAIHVASFAMSCGPLGYTYVGETPTPRLRMKTVATVQAGTSVLNLLFTYTTPIMLASPGADWGLHIGYFWAGTTTIGLTLIFFFVPETRGRTWNELDELFERGIPARKFRTTKTAVDDLKAATVATAA